MIYYAFWPEDRIGLSNVGTKAGEANRRERTKLIADEASAPLKARENDNMSDTEINIAAQEAFGEAVNSGSLDFDDLVAANSVDHDPAPAQAPGPQGYRDMFAELRAAFPDFHVEVEHVTAAGADVAFAYTITGTHEAEFQGHAASGKPIEVRGVQIGRFEDGKLVERWGSSDQLGILTQLGLVEA